MHSNIFVEVERSGRSALDELQQLFLALAVVVSPDYGMLHALTDAEITEARASGRPDQVTINRITGKSSIGAGYTKQLERGIPTIFWGNLFGNPYVDLFGRERLLTAPAKVVREEPWGIYLQVSSDPPLDATWPDYRLRRDAVIDHLGRAAFWPDATMIAATMRTFEPPHLGTGHSGTK